MENTNETLNKSDKSALHNGILYKKWRILNHKLSIQHYNLFEKQILNIPLNRHFLYTLL